MQRRRFLQVLAALGFAPAFGCAPKSLYQLSRFGNARLLHFTDCHAQLLPLYYREPSTNIGIGKEKGLPPHLTGQTFLDFFGIKKGSPEAYAFSDVDFAEAARIYGKMGGFAHLATLINRLRNEVGAENSLLLDGGDSWQGSATALWTSGIDMLLAANLLKVDVMTGHWEFTYGSQRVQENLAKFNGNFVAQNVSLTEEAQFDSGADNSEVFNPYIIKQLKNARIAIIGQAFPYTPIANPARLVPDWQFGIQPQRLQKLVDEIKTNKSADVIVLLSHNGMDVDLKLAAQINGLDIILGGHTHDAIPKPIRINQTWVTNAGSHGKFLAVVDLDIQNGKLKDCRYQLLPVFSNLLEADKQMQHFIDTLRQPFLEILRRPLATADRLLYRRDNYHGSFDQILLDSLLTVNDAEIAFSPGFRWGTSLLPGDTIHFEDLMNHTAITYPNTYASELPGQQIKDILEDVADNLFNPDPFYRQGGDMLRSAGIRYEMAPEEKMGRRIRRLRLDNGEPLQAGKKYKVSGWANVNRIATCRPIWDVATDYLLAKKHI